MRGLLVGICLTMMGIGAFAAGEGVSNGGGGGTAVVCRNVDGTIRRAILLDLYEAIAVYGLRLPEASGDTAKDFFRASVHSYYLEGSSNIGGFERAMIDASFQRFFDVARYTAAGEHLSATDDTGPVIELPTGCRLEQLAVFHDREPQLVEIDSEIWGSLDSLNRAALISHELIYHRERRYDEGTSRSTRAKVAHVFAVQGSVQPVNEGVPAGALSCLAEDPNFIAFLPFERGVRSSRFSNFRVFRDPSGRGTRVQFMHLAGRSMVHKTAVDIEGLSFAFERHPGYGGLKEILVAAVPGAAFDFEIPLENRVRSGWTVQLVFRDGEPIRLVTRAGGEVLSEEVLTTCD